MKKQGGEAKYYYYIPFEVDGNIVYTRSETLYRLFDVTFFKGVDTVHPPKWGKARGTTWDRRKLGVGAAKNYVREVKLLGLSLFHASMFHQPFHSWRTRRKGLVCASIYVAGYVYPWLILQRFARSGGVRLRHLRFICLPQRQSKWWSFYRISKRTFYNRLHELKQTFPQLELLTNRLKDNVAFYACAQLS